MKKVVTIVYQGELEHRDSAGNHGKIGPDDVHWMTAASGVVHEEKHAREFTRRAGTLEVVQLWVNLPAEFKMSSPRKEPYDRQAAIRAADSHAGHFLDARMAQFRRLAEILDRPPILVAPYDAELFGHWWYEGPEFLDFFLRKACCDQKVFELITPAEFLRQHPTHQVATPAASSWGEEGYWRVWLNEKNEWIYPHLHVAQERMTELTRRFPQPDDLQERLLKQAARELLLAQASDWPFILRTGTSPDYARKRVKDHLLRFTRIHEQLTTAQLDPEWLKQVEWQDNIFPDVNYRYWT
jgi:1,4-alpha-glucan branching enzyme